MEAEVAVGASLEQESRQQPRAEPGNRRGTELRA